MIVPNIAIYTTHVYDREDRRTCRIALTNSLRYKRFQSFANIWFSTFFSGVINAILFFFHNLNYTIEAIQYTDDLIAIKNQTRQFRTSHYINSKNIK